jgi:hypothetical protein
MDQGAGVYARELRPVEDLSRNSTAFRSDAISANRAVGTSETDGSEPDWHCL